MPDTKKLRVLKALTDLLASISVTDGYQHDLAGRVYRGRLILTEGDGLPALTILEPPQEPEVPAGLKTPRGNSAHMTVHPVLVQGFAAEDRSNPTDPAYRLLGDVQQRLSLELVQNDCNVLGHHVTITIGEPVVRPPDDVVSDHAFFWLPLTLQYVEDLSKPFA